RRERSAYRMLSKLALVVGLLGMAVALIANAQTGADSSGSDLALFVGPASFLVLAIIAGLAPLRLYRPARLAVAVAAGGLALSTLLLTFYTWGTRTNQVEPRPLPPDPPPLPPIESEAGQIESDAGQGYEPGRPPDPSPWPPPWT